MADEKQMSALFRRSEQLKRWEESETNRVSASVPEERVKVKFQDGCIFLAACSSSDTEEVQKLLDRGADINTANVDGLTALHQACIDDNQEMVEFLVEHNADVDVCDNEGWTPLHATASCGFTEIARYLISKGANLAAVNNDGDLPIDIIEDGDMECLLQKEMDNQGIDPESARNEEEQRMLADANQWLKSKIVKEKKHAKTGASALHVAAAKGYIKVMEILLQAGVDVDAKDHEGWTPLHAASHWAQQESCQILVENMANMDLKNNAGQTAFELADTGMVPILEELKKKQVKLRDKAPPPTDEIIPIRGQTHKRRTSITRMSGDQKANVVQKASERDRAVFDKEDVVTNQSDEENQETERQNEINKKSSTTSPMEPSRISQRPVSTSSVEDTKTESRSSGCPPLPPTSGYTSVKPYTSSYIPYYLRQQYQNEQREKKAREGGTRSPLSPTVTTAAMTTSLTSPTTTTTSVTTPTSTVLKPGFKTYEPPKRDDEAETQRRVKAKRARETRRSTQGVSLEDLKATGEIAISDNKRSERGQEVTSGDQTDSVNSRVSGTIPSGTDDLTSTTTSSYSRRRALEDRTKDEDSTRSTIRRSREAREGLSNSTDYTSSYIPRSQRNALSTSDINNTSSLGGSTTLSRTSSYRSRLRNGEIDSKDKDQNDVTEESRKDKSSSERETADGEKKETSAIRSRRIRRERRSTGIVDYNPEADEGGEKEGKENKTEDNKKDTENLSRPHSGTSNYSTTDSSRYSTRPTSYSEYSRSSTALDTDYKKLYEEEKSSNEKLKKELEQCKQELRDSKKELDRLMKKNSERSDLNSDKREKRALERKVSEMEEELKKMEVLRTDNARLKEENGALIRVISKLSK